MAELTPEEVCDRIADLCRTHEASNIHQVDTILLQQVLTQLAPEQPDPRLTARQATRFRGMSDREALFYLLREHDWTDDDNMERLADDVLRLIAGVRPVTLDRDRARRVLNRYVRLPDHGTTQERILDEIAACVTPQDGLLLTREEAALAAPILREARARMYRASGEAKARVGALAARLEREVGA